MSDTTRIDRREWLKGSVLAGLAAALTGLPARLSWAGARTSEKPSPGASIEVKPAGGTIPRRPLGKTGVEVSALCLGGAHLGRADNEAEAVRIVHEAVEAGVTFMDNAWEYHGGKSEDWMGKGLAGRRDKVFLMTKVCTHGRSKQVAMAQLEDSLRRLKTDYLDLWMVHEVIYEDDPDRHFMPGGTIDALLEARKQGKVRYLGFTGHKDPAIHLKMLARGFPFDACLMPLNVFDGTYRSFEHQVLPELAKQGIAPLAMKTLSGNGEPIERGLLTVEEALRYVLSLPIASLVSGIDSLEVLRQNLAIVRRFTPMPPAERVALRSRVVASAADGRYELFKSSRNYDGRLGREQHNIPY